MSFEIKKATRQFKKPSIVGSKNPNWKGGIIVDKSGRTLINAPDHPYPSKGCYVYRYRLVMESQLNRYLLPTEIIHHVNGDKADDRIENLEIMSNENHSGYHSRKAMEGRWALKHDKCVSCGTTDSKHKGNGLCSRCSDRARWPRRKKNK